MTVRKPLVIISGDIKELPAGDSIASAGTPPDGTRLLGTDTFSLTDSSAKYTVDQITDGPLFAALTQISGFTSANTLEVEANTKAARVTMRALDGACIRDVGFDISHHMIGIAVQYSALTSWSPNSEVFTAGFSISAAGNALAMIRKIQISAGTSAQTGRPAGNCQFNLYDVSPLYDFGGITRAILPAWQVNDRGLLTQSLKTRQNSPLMTITKNQNTSPALTSMTAHNPDTFSRPLASLIGPAPASIGTNIRPTDIWDCGDTAGEDHPIVLTTGQAIQLTCGFPPAGTSQSVVVAANMTWDEWVLVPRIGI